MCAAHSRTHGPVAGEPAGQRLEDQRQPASVRVAHGGLDHRLLFGQRRTRPQGEQLGDVCATGGGDVSTPSLPAGSCASPSHLPGSPGLRGRR